jgi:uncharacterized repeat protein (TIGR01451 family)
MAKPGKELASVLVAFTSLASLCLAAEVRTEGDIWTSQSPMPTPRRLLAAAAEGGKIYTFGGCGSPCFEPPLHTSTFEETRVEVYDTGRKIWEIKRPMSAILFGATAASYKGKIYTFGGYVTPNLTQEYDPETDTWTKKRSMPTGRYGLAAVVLKEKIYVLGGSGPSAAVEMYDPKNDTWTPQPPMPTARVFLAAAVVGEKIYAIGGSPDCCGHSQTNAVEIYDTETRKWSAGSPLPIAQQTSAAASVNGKIYILGGFIPGSGAQGKTLEYDAEENQWSDTDARAPLLTARDQAPAVVVDGVAYLLGGSVDCHCQALAKNESYTPPTSPLTPMLNCEKRGPESVVAGGLVTYRVTVSNSGTAPVAEVMLADPPPPGLSFIGAGEPCDRLPCLLGTIAVGQEITVPVTFRVAEGCLAPLSITNVASVMGEGVESQTCTNMPKTSVLRPPPEPRLECKKQGPGSAKVGDVVAYQVTVSNTGCAAAKNTTISDPTSPGLQYVSGPCVQSACDLGTIGPGDSSASGDIKFLVLPGCRESVVNLAKVNGDEAACPFETSLIPDLAVDVSAPAGVSGGEEFDVMVTVANAGPSTVPNVPLVVAIEGAEAVTLVPPGCALDSPGQFTCTFSELGCGGSEKRTFRVRAPACPACAAPGPIKATAELKIADADPSNNHDSTPIEVSCLLIADLAIAKEGPTDSAPGDELLYTITVKNVGCLDAPAAIVDDFFPAGLSEVRWCRDKNGPCRPHNAGDLHDAVPLAVGQTAVYRARGIVPPMCSEPLINTATVSLPPGAVDSDGANNQATVTTAIQPRPGVAAFCVSGCHVAFEGDAVKFVFVLLNGGPNAQADNPGNEFTDTLPAGLTLVGASATSGTVATVANTVNWNGAIPVCGTVTITINATVDAGTAGMKLCNQGVVFFDANGDGVNESNALSDDPDEPGASDPCCLTILSTEAIPTLQAAGLVTLALLLAGLALLCLSRRSP